MTILIREQVPRRNQEPLSHRFLDGISHVNKNQGFCFNLVSFFNTLSQARNPTMHTSLSPNASSMELLRTINHGLDLLCGHHFSESAATLRQAIKMIADAVQQQHDGRSAVPADYASIYFESVSIQDKLSDLHGNKNSFVDHNTLYLHQEVFVFRHQQHQEAIEGPVVAAPYCPRVMDLHARSLSGALMYNLAFAYHLQGLYERNSASGVHTNWEKAGRLYEVAMTSLQGTTAQSTPYVMLAVLNNQAHLSMQVWNFGSIHRNMEAMKFLLEQLLAANMPPVQNLDPMVLEAFHMNVVCAHGIEARSAPAA